MSRTDTALLNAIRSGDESAVATLYDRYSRIVYGVALRVLQDASAAEDVMQEVFMQLWRNPSAFDASRGALAAWLAVIARNRAIDAQRKRKPEIELPEFLPVSFDLASATERQRVIEKVRGALQGFPEKQRSALQMAFFEGLTHTEIAARTGEPLGTIKSRIRTALLSLRKALGES